MSNPTGVAVDSAGNLYVADTGNNRVLEFNRSKASPFAPSIIASMVFGQNGPTDFTDNLCNRGSGIPSASSLCSPQGLATDILGNLYVADTANNRVLVYNTPLNPKSGELGAGDDVADNVLGNLFSTNQCNGGRAAGDINGVGPDSLCGPAGVAVDKTGNLYVADTANNRTLAYVRIAPTAPALTVNPQTLDFPNTVVLGPRSATSRAVSVTLSNPKTARQNAPILIQHVGVAGAGDFDVAHNQCSGVLRPGLQCKVLLTFSPIQPGLRQGFLLIFANASNSPQSITLSGVGVNGTIGLSASTLKFANVKVDRRSSVKFLTVTNRNRIAMGFGTPAITGTDPSDFTITSDTCSTVAPGRSCRIGVAFKPQAAGTRTASLVLSDDVGNQAVQLLGVGR
jgi:hypothetical protein